MEDALEYCSSCEIDIIVSDYNLYDTNENTGETGLDLWANIHKGEYNTFI